MQVQEIKDCNKVIQIEVYPQSLVEQSRIENAVKQKLETVCDRFNKINQIIGINDISITFPFSEPLYQVGTKIKYDLEHADNRYTSSRSNFSILMEEFNDIDKTLKEYQADFHKETIFGQKEIEQVK